MDIEFINPKVWNALEKKITDSGLNESYRARARFSQRLGSTRERTSIGFKRGLMGDLTGEYTWFLMPIYSIGEKDYGNAVAMEAAESTGEESLGKVTYFFRILSREEITQITKALKNLTKRQINSSKE